MSSQVEMSIEKVLKTARAVIDLRKKEAQEDADRRLAKEIARWEQKRQKIEKWTLGLIKAKPVDKEEVHTYLINKDWENLFKPVEWCYPYDVFGRKAIKIQEIINACNTAKKEGKDTIFLDIEDLNLIF